MSLINRMLQDLDKRGSAAVANDAAHAQIRAVPEQGNTLRLIWGGVLLLTALSAAAWSFWRPAAPAPAKPALPLQPPHVPPLSSNMRMSLSIAPDLLALQENSEVVPVSAVPAAPDLLAGKTLGAKPAPVKSVTGALPDKPPVAAVQNTAQFSTAKMPSPPVSADVDKGAKESRAVKSDQDSKLFKPAKEVTPQQFTENAYRKALSLIDAGQLPEAVGALEQVLQLNPKHAAARQTLVGLLLESKRQDDALRKLQEGLSIDPAQAGMAMILARLQVERGNLRPALETLQRSLPHAADQADYQAFLAALLQREKRHKEAAEHYALALRKVPQNGLWWMGYGISLQADNRLPEAQDAFTRARASTGLSAELQAFVDQKLSQLQR